MASLVDELLEFQEFREEILPMLRADLKSKATPESLRKKYATYVEVRKLSIALGDPDSSRALAAIKDLNDRTEGKAKEQTIHTHKFEKLKDEEIDSILLSKIKEQQQSETDEH